MDLKGRLVHKLAPSGGSPGLVGDIAFSPDGKTLATRHDYLGVILWDLTNGEEWTRLDTSKVGSGRGLAFSPDGGVLAVVCRQMEPYGLGPPGFQFWDVSKRPGGRQSAGDFPPAGAAPIPTRNDALEQAILSTIVSSEGQERAKDMSVEVLPDGAVRIRGRVTSEYIKQNIERSVEVAFPIENRQRRTRIKRTVINEMTVHDDRGPLIKRNSQ
jgi:WD40 repeat protein